jgi:hypothetical protein
MSGRDIRKTVIETITLDTFCGELGRTPDLMKIDVEGAELLVLRGATQLLHKFHPAIILAVHPYWLPAGHSSRQLFELLSEDGYRIYNSEGSPVQDLQDGEYLCISSGTGTAGY